MHGKLTKVDVAEATLKGMMLSYAQNLEVTLLYDDNASQLAYDKMGFSDRGGPWEFAIHDNA